MHSIYKNSIKKAWKLLYLTILQQLIFHVPVDLFLACVKLYFFTPKTSIFAFKLFVKQVLQSGTLGFDIPVRLANSQEGFCKILALPIYDR